MASSVRSRKAKGRRLQNWVRDTLLGVFPSLEKDVDIWCAIMGESGVDIKLSKEAQKLFPFSVECKNKETWKGLYDAYDQAISNASLEPVVVLKMNKRDPLLALDFKAFLNIVKESSESVNLKDYFKKATTKLTKEN